MRATPFLAAVFIGFTVLPALAQAPPAGPPTRIRGTVEKLDGQNLMVKSRDGQSLTVSLAPNFTVSGVVAKSLVDIKPGDFVASTSLKGPDSKLKAIEVHILPENLRGVVAEAQSPWDLVPDSIMTNAILAQITKAPEGHVMKVTFKGNEAEVTIPDGIPIVGYVPADAGLLKPGAAVFISAQKQPDGTLTAARVTAEKDSVKPPM
jgi:hypothetical protein